MRAEVLDLALQILVIVVYGLGAVLFGAVGAYIEYHAIMFAVSGQLGLSLWAGLMGTTLVIMGIMTVRDKLLGALFELRNPA